MDCMESDFAVDSTGCFSAEAVGRKKKKVPEEATVELSKYDKLFKGKKYETARGGFVTVHRVDGEGVFGVSFKVYGKGVAIGSDFDGVHGQ